MPSTICQKIVFRSTKTKDLYDLDLDSKKHSIATGASASISPKEGGRYSAHDDYIKGKNLQLVKNNMQLMQMFRTMSLIV